MKSFLFHSFVGICFGAFVMVMVCFGIIGFGGAAELDSDLFVKNGLANMFCGWFFSVSGLIFVKEEWSLMKRTILHFFTVTFLYFVLSFVVGWIPFTIPGFLIGIGLFLLLYFMIWVSFYLYFYMEMKKLNQSMAER
ncbi:DUF3021 domain-containing protein [Salibacterium salarium]|uniref:DUF3021 domain-containing protein n=1 Tax=Salibacterium salarium TaxID=284579 RepID=A0A3R9P7P1_9BACI|nr:DUF3021 domain-containing protein [Salibacterium salarium]RSL32135.1 DUF3021 domain-containing protein [Salibacterium salarium]